MNEHHTYRTVITYKNYFVDFLAAVKQKVKDKIYWTFELIEEVEKVPDTYLKHLTGTDGLYVRVQVGSDIFRIFSFFDEGRLVVLANGFQKISKKHRKKKLKKRLK